MNNSSCDQKSGLSAKIASVIHLARLTSLHLQDHFANAEQWCYLIQAVVVSTT